MVVFVIQASMSYEPTRKGEPLEVLNYLSRAIQEEFECISPIHGAIETCDIPGRLIVNKETDLIADLGDMTSADAMFVEIMACFAIKQSTIFKEYLSICLAHKLCLNKYLI